MALHSSKDVHRDLRQLTVVPSSRQGVYQKSKGTALFQVLIPLVQHLVQYLSHQHLTFSFVTQAKVRIQVQQMAILPQQSGTEGMNGRNLRPVHQRSLAP